MKEHIAVKCEGNARQKSDKCEHSFGTYSKLRDYKKLVHEHLSILDKFQNYVFALQFLHVSLSSLIARGVLYTFWQCGHR